MHQKIPPQTKENGGSDGGRSEDTKKEGARRWKLYLDKLIISHLWDTSLAAPSLHHAARCQDRASGAGQPVDFPLSLSQRGPA